MLMKSNNTDMDNTLRDALESSMKYHEPEFLDFVIFE